MTISELEIEYMRAHSKYIRLVDANAPEKDIIDARTKLDELGEKVNEEYKKINDSLRELKVKSFYISTEADINEIKRFTDIWVRKDMDAEKISNEIRFYKITIGPFDLEDILRSLLKFKSIKLTRIEFKVEE